MWLSKDDAISTDLYIKHALPGGVAWTQSQMKTRCPQDQPRKPGSSTSHGGIKVLNHCSGCFLRDWPAVRRDLSVKQSIDGNF